LELLHTCYRITDIARSVEFYEALGFEDRRRMPIRDEKPRRDIEAPSGIRLAARPTFSRG